MTSDYDTLHPPRPSGRCPHRPLIFLWHRLHLAVFGQMSETFASDGLIYSGVEPQHSQAPGGPLG